MPRVKRRTKARSTALSAGWESLLFEHCGRVGVFMFLQGHPEWTRLMSDPIYRDSQIREIWTEHGDELLEVWAIEHPGVEPSILRYLAKTPAVNACTFHANHPK